MTQPLLAEYFPILVFLVIAGGIAGAIVAAACSWRRQKPNPEKLSAYECGFDAFDDTRRRSSTCASTGRDPVHHLRPGGGVPVPLGGGPRRHRLFGFWSMMVFLGVLTVGFIYEWRKGALEWE